MFSDLKCNIQKDALVFYNCFTIEMIIQLTVLFNEANYKMLPAHVLISPLMSSVFYTIN